jgi:nitric oxide reductase NorQ protein
MEDRTVESHDEEIETMMPVNRDYDWNEYVPEDIPEFHSTGTLERMMAGINNREETGRLPRFWIGGATGCGKTMCALYIAQENDIPLITIQAKYSMSEADLLGLPNINDDHTFWQDGPLTKAILASRDGPVILLIDEVNRARPESKSALFSALDDRCEVVLDGRGGEVVRGDAMNLITVGTINEGSGYYTEEMDLAEERRMGNKFDMDYLGRSAREKAVELLTTRTPAHEGVADELITAANDVREMADKDDSPVAKGVPTSMVISWAQTAAQYDLEGIDNPLWAAAVDAVIRPFYGDGPGEQQVRQTIRSVVDGAPFEQSEFDAWASGRNDSAGGDGDGGWSASTDSISRKISRGDQPSREDVIKELEAGTNPAELIDAGVDENIITDAVGAKARQDTEN